MADLATSDWAGDLVQTPGGDIATVDGSQLGVQRVIRRLFTNLLALLFHPGYGGGLLAKIGRAIATRTVLGLVRVQIFQEKAVSQSPPPQVSVNEIPLGSGRQVVSITYTDAETGGPMLVRFDTGVTPTTG